MQPSRRASSGPRARFRCGSPFVRRARAAFRRLGPLLLALPLLPLAACGERGEEAGAEAAVRIAADADPQELMAELQRIQQELAEIQERALEDPELRSDRESLERQLDQEMEALDPEAPTKQARQEELATEFEAAREAGEEEAARELAMETQELQADLQRTRQAALQTEEMTAAIQSFQEEMLVAMNEVDPRTDSLVTRAEAIVAFLQERMAEQQQVVPEEEPDTP